MPFFSVVIPVFNRADLVSATLDSVVAQSCTDWELIVVDDGSTDGTRAILADYKTRWGDKMQVLQQSHAGPGAARNGGVAASSGRYIAFLDSDDLWFPWTLAFYRRQLEQHDFPAFLMGQPLVFQHLSQWQRAPQIQQTPPKVDAFADYLQAQRAADWLSTSSFVVRRDALEGKAFCARAINCEDIDFTLQMAIEPGFVKVQTPPTFGYRQHAGGITSCTLRTVHGIEFLIESERAGRYPGALERRRQRLRVLGRHVRPALLEFIKCGHRRRAWRALGRTLSWHIELGRVRFLLGFMLRAMQPRRRVSSHHKGSATVEENGESL